MVTSLAHAIEDLLREEVMDLHGHTEDEIMGMRLIELENLYNQIFEPIDRGDRFLIRNVIDHSTAPWVS